MKRMQVCLVCCLGLAGCARPPEQAAPRRAEVPAREVPRRLPMRVTPPPARLRFAKPELRYRVPELSVPDLEVPRLSRSWQAPRLDGRFDSWHMPEVGQSAGLARLPEARFEFERGMRREDVFRSMKWDVGGGSLQGALDDYERQQQALRDKYVPFPIPVSIPIPF